MDDGTTLVVHTNKCEGLNSHLKHKIKRIRGTRQHYVAGYIAEACWRMNMRVSNRATLRTFSIRSPRWLFTSLKSKKTIPMKA